MKKTTFGKLMLALLVAVLTVGMAFASCSSCKGNSEQASAPEEQSIDPVPLYHDYDGVVQDFTAGTAQIQALHKQTMYRLTEQLPEGEKPENEGGYEWRNSRIVFNEAVTPESIDQLHVTDVIDVFYYWNSKGPWVQYISTNVKNGVQIPWPINDVWVEDANLSNALVELSAEDALQRLKEWNGILPKDCNFITLRLPVGPRDCNPQWTFGDAYNVLFIDAVTGEVRDFCPAFPPSELQKPLGEWP